MAIHALLSWWPYSQPSCLLVLAWGCPDQPPSSWSLHSKDCLSFYGHSCPALMVTIVSAFLSSLLSLGLSGSKLSASQNPHRVGLMEEYNSSVLSERDTHSIWLDSLANLTPAGSTIVGVLLKSSINVNLWQRVIKRQFQHSELLVQKESTVMKFV